MDGSIKPRITARAAAARTAGPAARAIGIAIAAIVAIVALVLPAGTAGAWESDRVDSHAPIGVMLDHVHEPGEWMMSYRYTHMGMGQNYSGDSEISDASIVDPNGGNWIATPTSMDTNTHMFGLMYTPLEDITLVAMIPYVTKSMDSLTGGSFRFTTRSDGVGDLKLSAIYRPWHNEHHSFHYSAGFSSPTGQINARDTLPNGVLIPLPYPMQLGSGTFDLLYSINYLGQIERWSWGAQGSATIRLGTNENSYRLGHQYDFTGWGARQLTRWLSVSARINWRQTFNIEGADPALAFFLNNRFSPAADPNRQALRRLDALFGLNWMPFRMGGAPEALHGIRLALEGGLPMYQNLDGPQLGQGYVITTGLQYAF